MGFIDNNKKERESFVKKWADTMLVLKEGKNLFEGSPSDGFENPLVKDTIGTYDEIKQLLKKNDISF